MELENVLELVYALLTKIEDNLRKKQPLENDDEVLIMSLRTLFRERVAEIEAKGKQEGRQEGILENIRTNIISILEKRFPSIPSEIVKNINKIDHFPKLEHLLLKSVSINSIQDFQNLL